MYMVCQFLCATLLVLGEHSFLKILLCTRAACKSLWLPNLTLTGRWLGFKLCNLIAWLHILPLTLSSSGKLLNSSRPWFQHLQNGLDDSNLLGGVLVRTRWVNICRVHRIEPGCSALRCLPSLHHLSLLTTSCYPIAIYDCLVNAVSVNYAIAWNIPQAKAIIKEQTSNANQGKSMSPPNNCILHIRTSEKRDRQMPAFVSTPTYKHRHEPPAKKEFLWIRRRNFIFNETLSTT